MTPSDRKSMEAAIVARIIDPATGLIVKLRAAKVLGIEPHDPWGRKAALREMAEIAEELDEPSSAYTEHGRDTE